MVDDPDATIAIIEDHEPLLELYAGWLEDRHRVLTATSGRQAIEILDTDVHVILLDRRLPDVMGRDVLDRCRDTVDDAMVAMITAKKPTLDILELPIDEYLRKPVRRHDLISAVDVLLERRAYESTIRECFSMASRLAVLETTMSPSELNESTEYRQLKTDLRGSIERADETIATLAHRDRMGALVESNDP